MNQDRYVAAIEISSSKIIAAVGTIDAGGKLNILAVEQDTGVEGVRYGVIQNLEDTSLRIQRLIEKLQRRPQITPREITGLFVGLSGRSIRSITTEVHKNLPDDTEITDAIIADLRAQALSTAIDSSLEVIDAIPRTFRVGINEHSSPKGAVGNSISAKYDLIVCRPELKRNLVRTIHDKLGITIQGAIVTALSVGQIVLTAEEKRLGCMLVDMGAETTTVTIYKNGHLHYFATIPLGGRHITRDITTLHVLEERAEEIKRKSGEAIPPENHTDYSINGLKESDISNMVVARSEEIVANIVEQMYYAGLNEREIPGGIVCIGGGSKLRGMLELLGNQSGLDVRRGQLPNYISTPDSKNMALETIEVASVLYAGATNSKESSLEMPEREELPITGTGHPEEDAHKGGKRPEKPKAPKGPSIWDKIGSKVSSFFTGSEDDDEDPELL